MRVRVRFVSDQGAAPLRLEAGHTLASLQQAICEQVDRKLSEPLQISLNKKVRCCPVIKCCVWKRRDMASCHAVFLPADGFVN